ncbi:MAG: ATP-binding protein [Clostridia bacterium]|nr:ATP-binding protein [Clostridia bacterium]
MSEAEVKIPKRILNNLISSLSAGVVPRVGAPYIAIGRTKEIAALLDSLQAVKDGGAAVRFLIGRYGSGKTFLMQLIRGYALERGFLCADVDLSADQRRLCGGKGGGVATYRELMRNLASKASPEGGALSLLLSRYYNTLVAALAEEGVMPEAPDFSARLRKKIFAQIERFENEVGGFDFARVLSEYFVATLEDNEERKSACLRWLRGEFSTKTEAKQALGFAISIIITDENWYDFIKIWAAFSRFIGYAGLILYIDECIVLYKIVNRVSREANYEKLLTIFNDALQGRAEGLGIFFGGTPQFLEDTQRGLFSYEALRSRLVDSRYAMGEFVNYDAPVLRLRSLSENELYALLSRLGKLFAQKTEKPLPISEEEQRLFLANALRRAGSSELLTPREMIRDYMAVLSILDANPEADLKRLLQRDGEPPATGANAPSGGGIRVEDIEI